MSDLPKYKKTPEDLRAVRRALRPRDKFDRASDPSFSLAQQNQKCLERELESLRPREGMPTGRKEMRPGDILGSMDNATGRNLPLEEKQALLQDGNEEALKACCPLYKLLSMLNEGTEAQKLRIALRSHLEAEEQKRLEGRTGKRRVEGEMHRIELLPEEYDLLKEKVFESRGKAR